MDMVDGISNYNVFLGIHKIQLESAGVPNHYWVTLFHKLRNSIFDAGDSFSLMQIEYEENERTEGAPHYEVIVTREDGIDCQDPTHIYLVDHAWTFEATKAASHLKNTPGLIHRMCNIMHICHDISQGEKIVAICNEMWKFSQTYSVASGDIEDRMPLWYIMDEFGSRIQHSDDPNFRMIPFFYVNDQITYSLLFPITNVEYKEEVTRDYVESPFTKDEMIRKALLIPWKPSSFLELPFSQIEPEENYFLDGHIPEILPLEDVIMDLQTGKILKVYSDYNLVNRYLTHSGFQITQSIEEADILWLIEHYKDYKRLAEQSPNKFINQFPYENVITIKDLLAVVCRRLSKNNNNILEDSPSWFPTTYNLKTELCQFVSNYQNREKERVDNHWICKPWNLARGLDTHITSNINHILRLPFSGPKIAQKYIEDPVLFLRPEVGSVKFDVRYVLLLVSVRPLKVYVYRNFFLRFANREFDLNDFDEYEKHFTVMNYSDDSILYKMLCDEFKTEFQKQYPGHSWTNIEKNIFQIMRDMFQGAVMKNPPCGIGHNPQSRAMYAADMMLSWSRRNGTRVIQPKLLEVNWLPDCKRACEYYPNFYNDIFLLLFKGVENDEIFQNISTNITKKSS